MKKNIVTFVLFLLQTANMIGQESLKEMVLFQGDSLIPSYAPIKSFVSVQGKSAEHEIKVALELNEKTDAMWVGALVDFTGNYHDFYEEYYDGYKVYGTRCALHFRNGFATSITSNFTTLCDLDLKVVITAKEAIVKARQALEGIGYEGVECLSDAELLIYARKGVTALSYSVFVSAPKQDVYCRVFLSAKTGEVLSIESAGCNGSAATLHYGQQYISTTQNSLGDYELKDADRNVTTYLNYRLPTDADDNWTETAYQTSGVAVSCEVHYAMECTYDYFHDTFGRDSYDDVHGSILCYVSTSYDNAAFFCTNDAIFFKFGRDGSQYIEALDIVAHEFGHALFFYSIGQCQPAEDEGEAINEGMSDVWGACVENVYSPNSSNVWKMGDVMSNSSFWRSLSSPNTYSFPDTYQGEYWDSATAEEHKNSTVFSHWFYLLSCGGTGRNDNEDYYNVSGIGMSSAASICYQALSAYFCSGINYQRARTSTLLAAADLYGEYSEEYIQTLNAWYAVGVGNPIQITNNHLQVCQTDTFSINVPSDYVTWSVYPSSISYNVSANRCIVTVPSGTDQYTGYVVATVNGLRSYTKFFEVGDFVPDMAYAFHGTNGSQENLSLSSAENFLQFEFDTSYYSEEDLSTLQYETRLVKVDDCNITYVGTISGSGLIQLNSIPSTTGSYEVEVKGPCSDNWTYIWTIDVTR